MTNLLASFKNLQGSPRPASAARRRQLDTRAEDPTNLHEPLRRMELLAPGDVAQATLLRRSAGSEVYRVKVGWGTLCLKRASSEAQHGLLNLKRSTLEAKWFGFARSVVGESVPQLLGEHQGAFAMEYMEPLRYTDWFTQLREGDISPSTAAEVARLIGRLHAASTHSTLAAQFEAEPAFRLLRVEPLLLTAARTQTGLAERIQILANALAHSRIAVIHGDLVPRNILVGPRGPVLISPNCPCYADPAFDAACCLAHLLMLGLYRTDWRDRYLNCFDAFCAAYTQHITWEIPQQVDRRAALLIPAILLGSVHGEKPVTYLCSSRERDLVTAFARKLLVEPLIRLAAVRESWRRSFLG
jgi:streptomycin 6-kinase